MAAAYSDRNVPESIAEQARRNAEEAERIREYCVSNSLTNEQWYIEWEDALNRVSVADPNK